MNKKFFVATRSLIVMLTFAMSSGITAGKKWSLYPNTKPYTKDKTRWVPKKNKPLPFGIDWNREYDILMKAGLEKQEINRLTAQLSIEPSLDGVHEIFCEKAFAYQHLLNEFLANKEDPKDILAVQSILKAIEDLLTKITHLADNPKS